jgi:peptidoglycan/LPS O-acetylase OafA/YrhL
VSSRSATIQILQAGRGIAAIAVVIHHASLAARDFGGPFAGQRWLELGYLGVDFFFVLSGFIIYHSTVGRSKTARSYAAARARRIYIPYLPIGLAIALIYAFLPAIGGRDGSWSWLATLTLLPISSPALTVAWTLQHEVLFYFVFGVAWFCNRVGLTLAIWGIAIILNSAAFHLDAIPLAIVNLEFLMGVGVATFLHRRPPPLPFAAIPALLWLAIGMSREWSILVGASCALLIWRMVGAEATGRLAVPRWLIFLGAASYSIYLVHGPAISIAGRLFAGSWALVLVGALAAGMAAGIAYFLLVERPLLNATGRFMPRSIRAPGISPAVN